MHKENYFIKRLLIFVLIFSFLSFLSLSPKSAKAQVQGTDVVLSLSPEYPKPNQNITATLSSYVININKANISWYLNGEIASVGIGKNTFSFTLKDLGAVTTLTANIEIIGGNSITKSTIINGSDVDMLWEATDSYVPPFYKGKALVSKEGAFKVVAIPNIVQGGVRANPNNLSYTWKKDGKGQSMASGWGKGFYSFNNSYLETENTIEVKVSDISGGTNTGGKVTLRTVNPRIVFYKKDPFSGTVMSQSIGDNVQIGKEGATIVAIPYFFSPKNLSSSNLDFKWTIGTNEISTPATKNEIKVKGAEGASGTTAVRLLVENTRTLFQNLEKKINVSF